MFLWKNQTQFTISLWDLPYCISNIIEQKNNSPKKQIYYLWKHFLIVHDDCKCQNHKLVNKTTTKTKSTKFTLHINSPLYNTYNSSCLNHLVQFISTFIETIHRFSGLLCWLCAHFFKHHTSQNSHSEYLPNVPTQTYIKHE